MSKSILNPIFCGLSGRVGDVVFRTLQNGTTYVSRRPVRRPRAPTAAQLKHQDQFKQANAYATAALADPLAKAFYETLATTAVTARLIAVRDFLKPPLIEEIAVGLYDGLVGDDIVITASDDAEVASVQVAIKDVTGRVLESGPAHNRLDDTWTYSAVRNAPSGQPLTIEVRAKDRPGHVTIRATPWLPRSGPETWALPSHGPEASLPSRPRLIT